MSFPYFRYFIGDHLKAKMGMTHEQKGLYGDFLDLSWEQDPSGTLPNDDAWLANIAHLPLAHWITLKPIVLRAWTRRGRRLVNPLIVQEYEKALQRSVGGKKAVGAREAKKGKQIDRSSTDHRSIIHPSSSSSSTKDKDTDSCNGQNGRSPSARRPISDEEWFAKLKKQDLYHGLDLELERTKALVWLSGHPGRTFTRRFFCNWLVNALNEKPMQTETTPPPGFTISSNGTKRRIIVT